MCVSAIKYRRSTVERYSRDVRQKGKNRSTGDVLQGSINNSNIDTYLTEGIQDTHLGDFLDGSDFFGVAVAALGDLDGDGDIDLFIGNYYNDNEVLLNDGSGGFTSDDRFGGGSSALFSGESKLALERGLPIGSISSKRSRPSH